MGRCFGHGWHGTMLALVCGFAAHSALAQPVLRGPEAYGDWKGDRPGLARHITPEDLPRPGATRSASNVSRIVSRPAAAAPQVPDGFRADLFAEGLSEPRIIRV